MYNVTRKYYKYTVDFHAFVRNVKVQNCPRYTIQPL